MLSNACKYAIRAVTYIVLYEKNNIVNSKFLSEKLEIPEHFLAKILQNLSKNEILNSYKGISGGFKLNKNPYDIYFIDIIKLFDGVNVFNDCVLGMRICTKSKENRDKCPFRTKVDPLLKDLYNIYSSVSIGEFCENIEDFSDTILI